MLGLAMFFLLALPKTVYAEETKITDELIAKITERIEKALEAGDRVAMEAVDRACHYLAIATGSMINTFSPDLVLYGGGVIEAVGDLFLEKILAEVDRYCMPQIRSTVDIKNASLGDDSILYGDLAMIKGL